MRRPQPWLFCFRGTVVGTTVGRDTGSLGQDEPWTLVGVVGRRSPSRVVPRLRTRMKLARGPGCQVEEGKRGGDPIPSRLEYENSKARQK